MSIHDTRNQYSKPSPAKNAKETAFEAAVQLADKTDRATSDAQLMLAATAQSVTD